MAKFKVQDPTELENLIQAVPQSKTPQYTSSVAKLGEKELGKYDQGVTMFTTPEARRELNYQNQTGWQAWGNAVGQSLAEVTAGTLEGFGYLLDLEQHVKALAGTEKEFDNEFSKAMRQFKDSVREEMPVFTDPDKPFDPLNSRWWASNLPSIVSTLTLMVPTGAAVGAFSKIGRGLSKIVGTAAKAARVESGLARGLTAASEFLSADTKMLGGLTSTRAIGSGMISRVLESTMEAAGNADQVYKELIAQGVDEKTAREEAGKVASNTYYANLPLMLSDMFEYSVLFRNKGIDNAVEALNKQTKKSLLKNSLAVGGSFLSEGLEEGYQYGVGQEAKRSKNASETMGNVVSNFGEYFEDPEFLSSVVVGGMSGAGFQAIGNLIESRSAKLANVFPEFNGEALQALATSTGQSISNLKVAGQTAFNKFKGNLQEALSNTEEAIKSIPEGQREIFKLGLEVLKQTGTNIQELGTQDVPTLANDLWNGAKEKINTAISRIKKWAGINEKIQQLEATGNEAQAEILKKSEFVKLVEVNTPDAEKYMQQAKESGIDITEYEDILNTYKEGLVQHQGNQDAANAEVQAEIRRQARQNLQDNITKLSTKYSDFDLNSLRGYYLDKEGSPEAKSLKSGLDIDKTKNKNVPKSLKNKVKQLVDLEIEEVRLTKEADKLDTKAGQEELQAKKNQERLDEIKTSTDPNVLFEAYQGEDVEMSKLAKNKIDSIVKEEFEILPDPRFFETADKFKEFITTKDFPMLGLVKTDPGIDNALTEYWNKNTLASERPPIDTFENSKFEKVSKLLLERDNQTEVEHYEEFEARTFIDPEIEELRKKELDKISGKLDKSLKPFVQYLNSVGIEINKKYKASDVIEKLKPLLEKNNIAKEAFNAIQTQVEKLGSPIIFLNNDIERNDKSRGAIFRQKYHVSEIFLNNTFLNHASQEEINRRIIFNVLHELIHSLTDYKFHIAEYSNEKSSLLTTTDKETISKLNQLFEFLKGRKELKGEYGITNVHELITETISNPTFASKLKKIKVEDKYFGSGKNIFEYFIDLITRLFSGHKSGSAFEASVSLISNLIENSDVSQLNIIDSKFSIRENASEMEKMHNKYNELSYEKFKNLKGASIPELDSELPNYNDLNENIQENLQQGDFMLHSQLWSMSKGTSGLWWDRQFNKVTQKDIDNLQLQEANELFDNLAEFEREETDKKGRVRKTKLQIKDKVSEGVGQTTYSFVTTIEGDSISTSFPKVTKSEFIASEIYNRLDANSKDLIDELPEDSIISLEEIVLSKDSNTAAGYGNGRLTIGYTSKSEGISLHDINLMYKASKVVEKYDKLKSKIQLGNNKYNSTGYNDWTDDEFATEELFNNFGDYRQYEVFFETQPKSWTDYKTGKKVTTDINNHWIRLFVVKDGKKIYIGQLQRTDQTADKERTNTKALAELRQVADEALKTLKPGESKVIGQSRIVSYDKGLYNNLAKPRDVRAALTQEELDNIGIGIYMGEHEELGLMKTNRYDIKDIKPVNAKPGSVYVAKKTPTGDWQWFACITKKLGEMPELVDRVKELLAPLESTDPVMMERIKTGDIIRNILSQLRSIVRYKVNGKLEPDFNSKIVNVKAYHVDGKFNVDKFIEVHNLLDRPVQIDPKKLDDEDYIRNTVLDRLITDIDVIPFVNPFITVAPPDINVLKETVDVKQEPATLTFDNLNTNLQSKEDAKQVKKQIWEVLDQLQIGQTIVDEVLGTIYVVTDVNVSSRTGQKTVTLVGVEKNEKGEYEVSTDPSINTKDDVNFNPVNAITAGSGERQVYTFKVTSDFLYLGNEQVVVYDKGKYVKTKAFEKVVPSKTETTEPKVKLKRSTSKKQFLRTDQKPTLYQGQIDIDKAVRELKRIVPNGYTINVLKDLIQSEGVSAYGMVHDAAIVLSEKAPYGTEYHEAWHAIEQVLPKFQYDRIKNYLTAEDRADLFAEYGMTNQAPSLLKRIFQLVKAFIQDLINYHPSLIDLFDRANAGYYKNKSLKRHGLFYKVDGMTERNKHDFVNVYLAEVGEHFDLSKKEVVETLIDPNPQQNGLTFLGDESPLVSFISQVADVKGIEEANKLLKYIREDLSINEEGEIISTGTPKFGVLYPELLKALGKRGYKIVLGKTELNQSKLTEERELEDGEAFEEAENNTLEGWQESASLRSPIEKLSKRMKQLIYSVRSDREDSLGLGMNLTYNGYDAYARLASVIVDSIDVDDMIQRIEVKGNSDRFFESFNNYIKEKFANTDNIYTELYKALGDKTQPQFWVTQEFVDPKIQVPGEPDFVEIRVFEANRASIKQRTKNILGDYTGTDPVEFKKLLDIEDVFISHSNLKSALALEDSKKRFLEVWKLVGSKVYSKFLASHLNVEGKKQYEIINGGFFSKLTQRLQRDFDNLKAELFDKDPMLKGLPILQSKPKAGDFQFIINAGYKDKDGNGLMYNNFTEKEFVTSTFNLWLKENLHTMPILSDSPNLIGIKYKVPEGDREEMIAKIIHLEHSRSKNTYGIKNYNPETFIFNEIPYKENFNEQVLEVTKYFDKAVEEYKAYVKEVGAIVQFSSKDRPNLVREYLLEHAVVHSQMSMMTVGHLSFYKNLEDYYKRAKEIWSPVIKGNVNNVFYRKDSEGDIVDTIDVISKWQNVNVLPTVESPSSQAEELESIGFTGYKKVDKTDAQSEIDLISYRDRMITLNEWTEEHQVAYDQLEKGVIPTNLRPGLFNVLKPFYFNLHIVEGELISPVQKKDSELLILPVYGLETINGQENPLYNPLWKKHLEMMGYNFETMSYDYEGRRQGKYFDVITYDTTIKVGKRNTLKIDLAKWGKQQETPEHHYMSDAIFGTQIMKLITGNLEGTYNVDGASVSAKALWKEYNKLVSEWIESNYGKLLKELKAIDTLPLSYLTDSAEEALEMVEKYGSEQAAREAIKKTFTGENDSEKILKRMIVEEMINKGMRDDYIRSVQELPLTHPIHFNKVIQIINSFAKNNITDLKFDHGYTFANASSEGFKNDLKIKWNNNDPKLGIDHFEVYAPIHDPRIKNYLVNGIVDMAALQLDIDRGYIPNLLEGLVYRIPTEGKYSMFKIKIKGFLPVDNGVIFMPDMVTKIAGLDFDIDKVRGFFLGGNRRQDRILQLMMAVLSSPASLKEQLTPGGFDNLKTNNLLIRAYKAGIENPGIDTEEKRKGLEKYLADKMPFFSPITLSKIAKRMNTGKALIGTAANANAVHSLMEAYNFFDVSSYNDGVEIIYNGESLVEMSRRYDVDGNLISANIAELLAAFVDNGKDPQAEYSNITSDTIGTALYLLKKGIPLKAVQFFMTQISPEVVEAVKYGKVYESFTRFENFNEESLEKDLLKDIKTVEYPQLYSEFQEGARQFEQYIAGVKVANAGAGATMVDNYLKIRKYKNALENQTTVLKDSGLTNTLIDKGLLQWNDFIVNTFKVPDVNRGTIVGSLDLLIQHVLERLTDSDVKDMYNSFITFVASGYFEFDQTIVNKLNDPETLKKYKLMYPTNKFLNRLEHKDNFLQFAGANTNDELEIQAIIDNWEELLNSEDENTRNFANALIKYSFYQRGFDFGMGSFGHLIPTSYFIKNTEFTKYYTETMKSLDQANQEKANLFVEQYVQNNYLDVKIPVVKGEVVDKMIKLENPPSIGDYIARYVRQGNFIYKHVGGGVYKEMTVRADYVKGNKYLQRYNFNGKVIEFNSEKSEKQFIPQTVENPIETTSVKVERSVTYPTTGSKTLDNFLSEYFKGEDEGIVDPLAKLLTPEDKKWLLKAKGWNVSRGLNWYSDIWDDYSIDEIRYYLYTNNVLDEVVSSKLKASNEFKKLKEFNEENKEYIETYKSDPDTYGKELRKLKEEYEYLQDKFNDKREDIRKQEILSLKTVSLPEKQMKGEEIRFEEEQSTGYRERTIKNASADATIALASDFETAGEKLTKNSVKGQGKQYIPIDTKNLSVTPQRVDLIVKKLNDVNAKTLNIAGNGIYSLPYTQDQVDEFTYQLLKAVLESPNLKNKIELIRSGGQTGFDEAGVKAGRRLGIPTLVLAPKGWKFRNKQGQDISNEQQFKARFDVQIPVVPSQEKVMPTVKGEEISSYSDNLAFALTNPVFTSPTGQEWKRDWKEGQKKWREYMKGGIVFDGVKYRDVEQAYQKNKLDYPVGEIRDDFMLQLLEIKLKTYPKLVEGIDAKGGVEYLKNSTHQPTKQNSHWETGGDNAFIKLLTQAYMNVKGLGLQEGTQLSMFNKPSKSVEPKTLQGQMTYSYGSNKRSDVTATSTFEAIQKGERTATTRYESQGNIDYWKQANVGDVIEFSDGKGNKVKVQVTKALHKLQGSGKTPEQWSKLEGWSVEYFNNKVKPKLSEAWQIEYKLLETPITFTQEMADRLNEITKDKRTNGFVYTVKYLNNIPEERKQRAYKCYVTGQIPN